MISSTVLITHSFYYPIGNTPPVSLTQDLPPEQDADILLLGCGDARNVLFSCFVDNARRMDITCCDNEPAIHARNVLLYTLLIDDKANLNIDRIWNIYYHWMLDEDSSELLETQIEKLLQLSESIDQWHNSVYGSNIRFCDETSLSHVRNYWSNFSFRGLSPSDKDKRVRRLKAASERALAFRKQRIKGSDPVAGLRSTLPAVNCESILDFCEVYKHWWAKGTVPLSAEFAKTAQLNPTFFYSPTETLTLHYTLSPLIGFPLSTAYTPISKGSAFHLPKKDKSSIDHLVECAKRHFTIWALSFRIAVSKKLIIRIFAGDALAFCFSLCSYKQSVTTGKKDSWFRTNSSSSLINLLVDQDKNFKTAPLTFDVIDTSNLSDHFGALNFMALGSILLKHHASCSLYTETLLQYHSTIVGRLSNILCADVRTMSLLLGFTLPDLFTNASNSVEEDYIMGDFNRNFMGELLTEKRSRLRWKRSREFQNFKYTESGKIEVEAKALAKYLAAVYDAMFKHDDQIRLMALGKIDPSAAFKEITMYGTFARYNRASFAFLLSALKTNVNSDWDLCVEYIYSQVFSSYHAESKMTHSVQDLMLSMHLFGVDNGRFTKPSSSDIKDAVLAPVLPLDGLPDQLCVTIRVPRKCLREVMNLPMFKNTLQDYGGRAFVANFEGGDPGDEYWLNHFSAVQITFGSWHEERKETDSYPYIEEDLSQLAGPSDMYASVFVPTSMLLSSKHYLPSVKVCFLLTPINQVHLSHDLGPYLCFASSKMTSKDVFITIYMPGTSALPNYTYLANKEVKGSSNVTTLRLTDDGSKAHSLIGRISLQDDDKAREKLSLKTSEVKLKFLSPFVAVASIAESLKFKIQFPLPVSMSKFKVRIARKSSYIEVETPLLDPAEAEAANFMFPLFLSKVPSDLKTPMLWSAMRINLDAMPPIDLRNEKKIPWMNFFFSGMIPHLFKTFSPNAGASNDSRRGLKRMLYVTFMQFAGLLENLRAENIFALTTDRDDVGVHTLIFGSKLRLDLANLSVVLDAAVIPLSHEILQNMKMKQFLAELFRSELLQLVNMSEGETVSWKVLLPAMVERCRASNTWRHSSRCEYLEAGEVPLPQAISGTGKSSICSCGVGKGFSADYLKDQKKRFSEIGTILNRYATRAAIGPIFSVPYVEDIFVFPEDSKVGGKCENCHKTRDEVSESNHEGLKKCSKCMIVKYCSRECQKADWIKHKPVCESVRDFFQETAQETEDIMLQSRLYCEAYIMNENSSHSSFSGSC